MRRNLLVVPVLVGFAVLSYWSFSPKPAHVQTQILTPGCKLEPVAGPMRCADANDANSFYALKRVLFGFVKLDIPRSKNVDPLCIAFTPQTMLEGSDPIPERASPDAPLFKPYHTYLTYKADLRAHTYTIIQVTGADTKQRTVNTVVRLYDVPQWGWPCNLKTWAALLGNKMIDASQVPDRRYP